MTDFEDNVRFHDKLSEDEIDKLPYNEIVFRGNFIYRRREEEFKNGLIFSSFSSWQILSAQGHVKVEWQDYARRLNLIEKEIIEKGSLRQDFTKGLQNAEKILNRLKKIKKEKENVQGSI